MASDNSSIKSTASKPKTPLDGSKKVGFARPTLIIPPPQAHMMNSPQPHMINSPYSANMAYSAGISPTPEMYGRKASMFMFSQFNGIKDFTMSTAKSGLGIGEKCSFCMYNKIKSWSKKWFTHFFLTIVIFFYTVGGAIIFVTIEGQHEKGVVESDLRRDMDTLILELRDLYIRLPQEASEEEWLGQSRNRVIDFKSKVIEAYKNDSLLVANSEGKVWTMWNAVVYCATIYTTIGYGHISPSTTTGRALTIVYAIIGIPLFLIALTDFGKLFTRAIKFVWSFVRRLYYTGSCRKVRKTAHVQEIFKGAQMMYEIATFRRPSVFVDPENPETPIPSQITVATSAVSEEDTPTTPAISNFEIDDEFNLPISLALFILIAYIFIGAVIYCAWEKWNFFASFYFVFISMSTIGFGDYVPKDPACMIVSIVYLVFGLALMSMCINVVQAKLSDTFKQASVKLGATIGFQVEDDGSVITVPPENVEMPDVHASPEDSNKVVENNISEREIEIEIPKEKGKIK